MGLTGARVSAETSAVDFRVGAVGVEGLHVVRHPLEELALADAPASEALEHFGQLRLRLLEQVETVQRKECRHGRRSRALVAVDEGLILREEEPVRSGLLWNRRIGVFAEDRLLGLEDGGEELLLGTNVIDPP